MYARVSLKPGREKPVRGGHPWIFSGAVDRIDDAAQDGGIVDVHAADGSFLARGYLNRRSQITIRLLTTNPDQAIDEAFWESRLRTAIERRARLPHLQDTDAIRLVFAESDDLPGLIVDRYGDVVVIQALTLGIESVKETLIARLASLLSPRAIVERSDVDVRAKEGLAPQVGCVWGELPPQPLVVHEQGAELLVDVLRGQKTGLYLDQRDNWRLVGMLCSGKSVLNAFAYTGAFGVAAARGGARRVVQLDTSEDALRLATATIQRNGYDHEAVVGDAFRVLRQWYRSGYTFDVIILDPPRFAASVSQLPGALRGYKDINMIAMRLLAPGGFLATFSCSGVVTAPMFQQVVWEAAIDAQREMAIVARYTQAADHPVRLTFPESEYLKGLLLMDMSL